LARPAKWLEATAESEVSALRRPRQRRWIGAPGAPRLDPAGEVPNTCELVKQSRQEVMVRA